MIVVCLPWEEWLQPWCELKYAMFMEDDIAKLFTICYTRHSDTGLFLPLQFAEGKPEYNNAIYVFSSISNVPCEREHDSTLWARSWDTSITPVIIWAWISKLWYKTGLKTTQVHTVRGIIRHLSDSKCRSLKLGCFWWHLSFTAVHSVLLCPFFHFSGSRSSGSCRLLFVMGFQTTHCSRAEPCELTQCQAAWV